MRLSTISSLVIGLAAGAVAVSAQSGTTAVSAPAARTATLEILARIGTVPPAVAGEKLAKDPFHPAPGDLTDLPEKGAVDDSLSDKERLEAIAAKINPTGSVELGGEPYLLFTEKRQKIGDKVTVSIGEVEYEVEIVSIDKSRFRLRYNNLETTRSIK